MIEIVRNAAPASPLVPVSVRSPAETADCDTATLPVNNDAVAYAGGHRGDDRDHEGGRDPRRLPAPFGRDEGTQPPWHPPGFMPGRHAPLVTHLPRSS